MGFIKCRLKRSTLKNSYKFIHQRSCFSSKPYFITTPIFYVNAEPHIGHFFSAVLADTFHRFHLLKGVKSTIFSTGTDEHGIKIQNAAKNASMHPSDFCDKISTKFKHLCHVSSLTNTHFIRTTDENHKIAVQHFWNTLKSNGAIYKSKYEGWYSISDEAFVPESHTEMKENARISTESGHVVEWSSEENYMFKLSNYKDQVIEWIEKSIKPESFTAILRNMTISHAVDISISRPVTRLAWGIPVPDDPNHTIYVWLDALVNYLTVAGYPNSSFTWPPDCQVIGKDILRFHGLVWPALLIAAGLEPPRALFCHSHWQFKDVKMSKSLGNVVDPFKAFEQYSVDGLRYFMLREGVIQWDGSYTDEKVKQYLNGDLADNLGNILLRIAAPAINKQQIFPSPSSLDLNFSEEAKVLVSIARDLVKKCDLNYSSGNFRLVIHETMDCLTDTNRFIQNEKTWELAKKSNSDKLEAIIYIVLEILRITGIILQPIIPFIADRLLTKLNIPQEQRTWADAETSFNLSQAEKKIQKEKVILFTKLK